ncbi:MAG: ABC transporter permease [Proteobacteria bacterium]|nr:ABC transporter permease [Pseudomonadota bacterium]
MSEQATSQPSAAGMTSALAPSGASPEARSCLAEELSVISTLWRRDMLHLLRERSRWLGVVLQPLLFWLLLGSGLSGSFRAPQHGGASYLVYFFPGTIVMVLLFTTIFATISVIEDRQSGFLQGVLVAPGSRAATVLGKTAGVTSLALIQAALLLLLAPLAGYPWAEVRWLPLAAVLVLGSAGLTAINFAMAWLLNSSQGYHALMSVVLLPLWVISGAMFPVPDGWLGVVMRLNPLTYIVAAVRLTLGGVGSPIGLLTSCLVLGGMTIAGLAWAVWATGRRPAGSQT